MQHAGHRFQQKRALQRARLQLTYTICFYTGCRINDASILTKDDIINAQAAGQITLIHTKTKHSQVHYISDSGIRKLKSLQPQIDFVFKESQFLFGNKDTPYHPRSVIRIVNRDLQHTCNITNQNLNIKSHSYRVGFIMSMLENHVPINQVAQIIC